MTTAELTLFTDLGSSLLESVAPGICPVAIVPTDDFASADNQID
ncbi:MAG: hypothetical protein ACRENX_02105 [Candidatus Dormibacteria bacterium]